MARRKIILPSWAVPKEMTNDVNAIKERFTDFSTGEILINTTPENVTLSTFDSNGNVATFVNETKVSDMISNALDESNYATEDFVTEEIAKIKIPSIEGLATKDDVNEVLSQIPSLEDYATKEFVKESIANAQLGGEGGEVDLSEYAKKSDIEGFVTEDWVGEQGFLTEHQDITGKQDVIEDLESIREGAAKGATALQEIPEGYATETWVSEQGFLTEHQDITGKQDVIEDLETIREGAAKGATALQSVPAEYVTETELDAKGYLTEHQDISHLTTKDEFSKIFDEGDSDKTIRRIANEELASQLILSSATESLDTLEEIAAWIQEHPEDAASMNAKILNLENSAHTHDNKAVLDGITSDDISKWNEPHEYLPLSGGSLSENGYIMFSGGGYAMKIFPEQDASMAIGGPNNRFADVYSEYFYGTLQGVAYSANTVPFTGIPTGTTSGSVAVGNHTHKYLPLSGGVISGILSTSPYCNIIPTNDGMGTIGSLSNKYGKVHSYDIISDEAHLNKLTLSTKSDVNTDIIRINNTYENSGFGYTFRYLGGGQGNDNALALFSDEYGAGPLFRILQDGHIVGNNLIDNAVKTLVTSAKTSAIASTVPFSGLPIGTTSETVAVGNHEHGIYATKTELNDIEGRVSILETEHNTLVLNEDKTFKVLPEEFNFGPLMSLNNVTPYFILKNGTYYNIENLNTWGANFGIEEGSFGTFSTRINCKPIGVENDENGNDVILVSVVDAYTSYKNSSGEIVEKNFGVLGINRTIMINNVTYNPNCIVQKDNTFKITVPHDVTLRMEEFRKETIEIGTESNLDYFVPEKIWKEVIENRVTNVVEFTVPNFKIGSYGDSNLFSAKYNLKLDSLPNTNVSNEFGVVIDKIKYHHDLILPKNPTIGKKIEILNNSLYGHKILAEGKNITFSFDNSMQMIDGNNGVENSNKIVTCIYDGEDWYIYKNI